MTTLANRGFLERLHEGQEYRLGKCLLTLGFQIIRRLDLPREALPYMREVADQFDETVDLSVYDRGEILCVQVVRSRRVLSLATSVGQRFAPHATATGKVVMAYLSEEEREAILAGPLARFTAKTITSPETLRTQIASVREKGYGYDDEEFEQGVRALAVPVLDSNGALMAVVSMPGPVFRLTEDHFAEIAQRLRQAAHGIGAAMGWQPPE
jgi:DNA-binding IclR family transcriptional regulator